MRYILKQKLFSFGDDFRIKDESGNELYFVDGKVFILRRKLLFKDMQGQELGMIQQKLLAWGPTYEIYRSGQLAAVVKKSIFTLFRCHFTVDVPGPDDLEAQGSFLDCEYTFKRGSRLVATVSKKWFSWTDTYGVEVETGEDDLLILASAVVIDLNCHDNKNA
jgi:uncharacterized protein YxjI